MSYIVFITVKSYDTDTAARDALLMIGPDTIVVSMQNGIRNVETLAGIVDKAWTVGAMAIFGAAVQEPGKCQGNGHRSRDTCG
ncbi:MAG: 2-dehydropantoate 2-reductase [Euryarchaeota archaeon]|nr:2-dehydropantoate 2-reductase [Euryarchaeota archaeon]